MLGAYDHFSETIIHVVDPVLLLTNCDEKSHRLAKKARGAGTEIEFKKNLSGSLIKSTRAELLNLEVKLLYLHSKGDFIKTMQLYVISSSMLDSEEFHLEWARQHIHKPMFQN